MVLGANLKIKKHMLILQEVINVWFFHIMAKLLDVKRAQGLLSLVDGLDLMA